MKQIEIHSLQETADFARKMAKLCQGQTITLVLDGDLGAGKTTWTQSFGKALGVSRTINSPTFTIMKNYKQANGEPFVHMDAYRLEGMHQDLGFEEVFEEGICVVEWGKFIEEQIPADHIEISFRGQENESRLLILQATGKQSEAILEGLE